jgi:type IV pilus assembly protein PilC
MATTATSESFHWSGTDKNGRQTKGEINASSQAMARAQLRQRGINPKSVRKKPKPLFGARKKPIKPADIAIFTRQLATMMKAGVPLVQSFDIVTDGLDNPSMKELVTTIKNDVAAGSGLALSLAKYPRHFDELFCSLVGAGESAGTLEVMLDRVATYKEKTEQLKAKIKKALTYPTAVVVVALVVTGILLVKVVPQFARPSRALAPTCRHSRCSCSPLGLHAGLVVHHRRRHRGSGVYFQGGESAPCLRRGHRRSHAQGSDFGNIVHNAVVARFSRTLATTFNAGVPLVEALESTAGASGNSVYSKAILQIRDDVTTGTTLYNSVRSTGLFPNMLLQMISIGEESGQLDEMLDKVANHYEEAVDNAVDSLSSLMEPMIMSVLGVLVGGLMIAMYLPIFMLGSVI